MTLTGTFAEKPLVDRGLAVRLRRHEIKPNVIRVGNRAMFERMNQALSLHRVRPVIDATFAFEDAPAAYRKLESQTQLGKVVIRW